MFNVYYQVLPDIDIEGEQLKKNLLPKKDFKLDQLRYVLEHIV